MGIQRLLSAYRLGLAIALVYVLWALGPNVLGYVSVLTGTARPRASAAAQPKLSAATLESMLIDANQVAAAAQLRCEPARRDWDYVCSYMPAPLESPARKQFGITVDGARRVKVSRIVPVGTRIPGPR